MAEIDRYLRFVAKHGASDLHLSSGTRPSVRLHGVMTPLNTDPVSAAEAEELLNEIMPQRNREEFEAVHDTDFAYELDEVGRFRTNIFYDRMGMGGVFRLIPSDILTADDIGLSEAIRNFCQMPKGLVLVTGPTGCGKSTTLAAMIDVVNKSRREHVITIEDPIEFVHQNQQCLINQREVHTHTKSFAAALRGALREDPDVVLVGEMRDLETTHIAIETAETGHLVFATLHTNTAASSVDRLIDQFPPDHQEQIRTMVAASLKGVISQVLLRRKAGGRVAAMEVLVVNPGVAHIIREGRTHQIPSMMQTGGREGMSTLNDAILKLVMDEIVSPEEALAKTVDRRDLLDKFKVAGLAQHGA